MAIEWRVRPADPRLRPAAATFAPALCAVAAVVVIASALMVTTPQQLQSVLRVGQFWFLDVLLVLVVMLSWLGFRQVFQSLDARTIRTVVGFGVIAGALVLVAPRTNRIFYDEQIYQAIGQNLSDLHMAQMCNDGAVEYGTLQCMRPEYNKQPYGYPHLLSVGYRLVGPSEAIASVINVCSSAATAVIVFLLTLLVTGEATPAAFAALAFAVMPEQLRWAHSAAVEPSAALACALPMLASAALARHRSLVTLLWTVASASWAAYFRPECLLVTVIVALALVANAREELRRPRFGWCVVLWLLLLAPAVAHLAAVRNESWGTADARFSLAAFAHNVRANTLFYVADRRFPPALTALAIVGGLRSRRLAFVVAWFAAFWGVFLFFYAGSYDYGADVRYSLMSYAPLAVLTGIGAARLARMLAGRLPMPYPAAAIAGLLIVQFTWYLPWVRAVGEEAWAARADVAFAREAAGELPPNAVVLTHNPGMFHLWGVSAAQLSLASTDPDYVRDVLRPRYSGGIYAHWNFWCNVPDPVQRGFCDRGLAAYPAALVRERRVRDFRYALFRLEP